MLFINLFPFISVNKKIKRIILGTLGLLAFHYVKFSSL